MVTNEEIWLKRCRGGFVTLKNGRKLSGELVGLVDDGYITMVGNEHRQLLTTTDKGLELIKELESLSKL